MIGIPSKLAEIDRKLEKLKEAYSFVNDGAALRDYQDLQKEISDAYLEMGQANVRYNERERYDIQKRIESLKFRLIELKAKGLGRTQKETERCRKIIEQIDTLEMERRELYSQQFTTEKPGPEAQLGLQPIKGVIKPAPRKGVDEGELD